MIDKWVVSNFKSISDKTELNLAPLTLFVGANSSGKSTVIQSILLVAQTIQNTVASRPIVLNGNNNKFGEYNDIVHNKEKERQIQIEFNLKKDLSEGIFSSKSFFSSKPIDFDSLSCAFRFSSSNIFSGISGNLYPTLERVKFARTFEGDEVDQIDVTLSTGSLEEKIENLRMDEGSLNSDVIQALRYEIVNLKLAKDLQVIDLEKFDIVGSTFNHFVPSGLTLYADFSKLEAESIISFISTTGGSGTPRLYSGKNIGDLEYSNKLKEAFIEVLDNALSEIVDSHEVSAILNPASLRGFQSTMSRLKEDFTIDNLKKIFSSSLMPQIGSSLKSSKKRFNDIVEKYRKPNFQAFNIEADFGGEYISEFFEKKVKYLGPLRDEPKSIYPLISYASLAEIGIKGENTAAILELNRYKNIEYISPRCFENIGTEDLIPETKTLSYAVQDWLSYMDIAKKVSSIDKGKFGHELKISTDNDLLMHDLTHVGVGVSQILPILVQALMAPKYSTLIFEQPELHLHPKVQSRLADFFISVLYLRKQCIVETHSEYMVNRIRYLIAKGDGKIEHDQSKIFFVKKNNGSSSYEEIRIDENGIIANWPDGFFDESEKIAAEIIKVNIQKSKKKKQ